MSELLPIPDVLVRNRNALLLAELAALMHDLGKLSADFIVSKTEPPGTNFEHHRILGTGFLPPQLDKLLKALIVQVNAAGVGQDQASFADFIELHHRPRSGSPGFLVQLLCAESRGADGADSGVDKGTPGCKQRPGSAYQASAFGIEESFKPEVLEPLRLALADGLERLLNSTQLSPELRSCLAAESGRMGIVVEEDKVVLGSVVLPIRNTPTAHNSVPVNPVDTISLETLRAVRRLVQAIFQQGLGETRRAANDVTLWDHAFSVASLYKAALAGMLLEGKSRAPATVRWRFFCVGWDGLRLISKGHKIGDSLGYREMLQEAQDAVRDIVEFEWAIGNEAYRDENGIYFVLPALDDLKLQSDCERDLGAAIRRRVLQVTDGEVVPVVGGESDKGSRGLTRLGFQIAQTDCDVLVPYPFDMQPTWPDCWTDWPQLADYLRDVQNSSEPGLRLGQCDVCGYRRECAVFTPDGRHPQVDGCPVCQAHPKCENQIVCPTCGQRRQSRAQPWLAGGRETTIWIDEVADRNDRVAVIIGRFELTHWLNGEFEHTYLNSLLSQSLVDWGRKATGENTQAAARAAGIPALSAAGSADYRTVMAYLKYVLNNSTTAEAATLLSSFLDFSVRDRDVARVIDSSFERAACDVVRTPQNLATLLFRKHPSPARLRRIWRTTETFWQKIVERVLDRFTYDRFSDPEKSGASEARTRRIALYAEGVSLPALAYDAQIASLRLSLYWDREHRRFVTLDNLQLLLEQTNTGSEAELRAWLNRQRELQIEEPLIGQARVSQDRGQRRYFLRGSEPLDDAYRPYVPVLSTPRTFMALVPGVDAADILQEIRQRYEHDFGKVRNRLPLHLGAVYFHRRSPLYAALDAARRLLPEGCRDTETWILTQAALPIVLADGRSGIRLQFENGHVWDVDVTTGDPDVADEYYPYFLVEADSHPRMVLTVPDPTRDNLRLPLVHARDLAQGDRVRIAPSLFDFEYLDTIGRRFEVGYSGGQRRPRAGLTGLRPYYLERLTEFRRLWWLVSGHYADEFGARDGLTPTQLSNLETLIGTQALLWGEGDWVKLGSDAAYGEYAAATLANIGQGWWKSLEESDKQLVVRAINDGSFMDVIELYRKIMKVKPLDKEVA